MDAMALSKFSENAVKELYGSFGETVLYWAHHEKLCVVDRHLVFMGGLDMCTPSPAPLFPPSPGTNKRIPLQALEDTTLVVSYQINRYSRLISLSNQTQVTQSQMPILET